MKLILCKFGDHPAIKLVSNLLWHQTAAFKSSFHSLPSLVAGSWVWRWSVNDNGRDDRHNLIVAIVQPERTEGFLNEQGVSRGETVLVETNRAVGSADGTRPSVRFQIGEKPALFLSGTDVLSDAQEKRVIDQLLRTFVSEVEASANRGFVSRTLFFRGTEETPEERVTN